MKTHPKKRIEVIVEAPALQRVVDRIDRADVSGYSILSVAGGRGRDVSWTADGQVGDASRMVAIVCITDAAKVDELLASIFDVVSHQIGFVAVSDVFVVRPDRF